MEAREYVVTRIDKSYLTKIKAVIEKSEELLNFELPKDFVMKPNHASGAIAICWNGFSVSIKLPDKLDKNPWKAYLLHSSNSDRAKLTEIANAWLSNSYSWRFGGYPEWAYEDLQRRVIIEEVLLYKGTLPNDFKFFMFDGVCRFIQVDSNRFGNHQRTLYTPSWSMIDAKTKFPRLSLNPLVPEYSQEMLGIASELSIGLDFVRVDLFQTDSGVKFGELTNYPNGGFKEIWPQKVSKTLAKYWNQSYLQG